MTPWRLAQPAITARYVVELAGIALMYLVLAKSGLKLALINPSASPVWPATGFALALVLLRGHRVWPAVFIAALIANATTAGSLPTSVVIASGNTLEALVGGHLIQRLCGGARAFDSPVDVAKFAFISIGPAALISATMGVSALRAGGFVEPGQFGSVWMTWWMGDSASALLLTPVIVLWAVSGPGVFDRKELTITAMLLAAASAVGLIVFTPFAAVAVNRAPMGFLAMVPLLWAALRRGQRDTATVALVLACFAIWGAAAGGPFARSSLNDVFMLVSMFVIGAALPSLALSAAVALRRQAEQRLRESEEGLRLALDAAQQAEEAMARLAAIVTSSSDAIIGTTLDGTVATWNEAAERLFGYSSEEMVGQPTRRLIPPNRQSEEDATLARVAAGGILESYETVRQHKSGRLLEVSVTVSPMRNGAGKVIGISKIARDITERKRAEEEMRESEERFRGIFEHAGTGIAITDLQGRIQSCNPAYSATLGYTGEELRGLDFPDLVHPEDREANLIGIQRLLAQEIPSFEILSRYVAKNGNLLWVHTHVSLLRDDARRPTHILALVTDMTERKRHEDHISLLMREVNHRSKNMLTLVQAVARQTLAANPDDFIGRFGERIQALAANQDLLVKNAWMGVDLGDLVRSQLAHFADLIGRRIELRGPLVFVSASAAQIIGMALHELATNAGKYGALSNRDGRVEIEWSLDAEAGEETFVMSWREKGGPPVTAPAKRGFGLTVIQRMVMESLHAQVNLDFAASGLSWRLRCQAKEVVDRHRSLPAR